MARRLYSVEEVIPIIHENDSLDSNGEDSVDLEDFRATSKEVKSCCSRHYSRNSAVAPSASTLHWLVDLPLLIFSEVGETVEQILRPDIYSKPKLDVKFIRLVRHVLYKSASCFADLTVHQQL